MKKINHRDSKNICGCQGLVGGRMRKWGAEDLSGGETTRCDATVVGACHYTFIETHRISIKGEPACKLWTLGYTDVSTQVYHFGQMYLPVLTEGEVGVWWKGHMGPLHFLLNATISLQRL